MSGTSAATPRERSGAFVLTALVLLPLVAVVVALVALMVIGGRTEVIEVVVPAGTGERMVAGERITLLPPVLEVSVGDTLEIRNLDDVAHEVGPYAVAAGQTLRQTFTTPGTIQGTCSLNPGGEVTIVVR
jgi:plastocyanin